ncbi:MAG: acetyl-CoA decarbonylase/synthase complex subunit delta [archaeon]
MLPAIEDRYMGRINEITVGLKKAGGEDMLPLLGFDRNRAPLLGLEIQDIKPEMPDTLAAAYGDATDDPVNWAAFCEKQGIDLLSVRFEGANPQGKNRTDEEAAGILKCIQENARVPLLVYGTGNKARDGLLMDKLGRVLRKNSIIGNAEEEGYKSVAAAAIANDHYIISFSPIDINIAKQMNILLTEFGIKQERIIMDPLASALGYGLEYSYSIIERLKLAALAGDKMLSMPIICNLTDVWNCKESYDTENPSWGDAGKRGIMWETLTAVSMITAGADIVIMRHPQALKNTKKLIKRYLQNGTTDPGDI